MIFFFEDTTKNIFYLFIFKDETKTYLFLLEKHI